jgi:lipopolysaccharide transport system permease protein
VLTQFQTPNSGGTQSPLPGRWLSLLRLFVWRDLRLSVFWAFLQPIIAGLMFTWLFSSWIPIQGGNVPYLLFILPGMGSWFYFTHLIYQGGSVFSNNQQLIRKIYFPRLILPASKSVLALLDLIAALFLAFVVKLWFVNPLGWQLLLLPLFVLFLMLTGFAFAIWIASLGFKYRDVFHFLPFILGLTIWLTPVFYPTTMLPQEYGWLHFLNPVAAAIDGMRWCLISGYPFQLHYIYSLGFVVLLLASGLAYFRYIEPDMADSI